MIKRLKMIPAIFFFGVVIRKITTYKKERNKLKSIFLEGCKTGENMVSTYQVGLKKSQPKALFFREGKNGKYYEILVLHRFSGGIPYYIEEINPDDGIVIILIFNLKCLKDYLTVWKVLSPRS